MQKNKRVKTQGEKVRDWANAATARRQEQNLKVERDARHRQEATLLTEHGAAEAKAKRERYPEGYATGDPVRDGIIPPCPNAWVKKPLRTHRDQAKARLAAIENARKSLLHFMQLMMPDNKAPNNSTTSEYKPSYHHHIIAETLEQMEEGLKRKVLLTCPPRHGKTALATIGFVAWFLGRNPTKSVIVGTYNSDYAADLGRQVRDFMLNPAYQLVFPGVTLKDDSRAADRLRTAQGGAVFFVGRGGAITGRGGDLLIVDDPLKDDQEAASPTIRQVLWQWFNKTFMTRGMTDKVRVMCIMTRWHEDDLIGRLSDPANPDYSSSEAKQWHKIDLPALCTDPDNDPLGRDFGDPLWPQRFNKTYLEGLRHRDPVGFSALYQCSPAPPEGIMFTKECLRTYQRHELPSNLRIYMASDHAVSMKQQRDKSCIIAGGVDEDDNLWILPDIFWRQASADQVVEGMLDMISKHKPLIWWAEAGAIGKSLGPFLRKRMQEESTYCAIHEVNPGSDKLARAQAIHGRAMGGKVFFPSFAPWWSAAKEELMKFPTGTHDDFVDTLGHLGRGLAQMTRASAPKREVNKPKGPQPGTLAWVKHQAQIDAERTRNRDTKGW